MEIGPVTLEGAHVLLEPLGQSHFEGLSKIAFDPDLWRLNIATIRTADELKASIEAMLAAQAAGTMLPFATIERRTQRVIGSTRFMNIERAHRRLEIGGTWIAKPWQRTVINTEAKYLMLRHAFEELGCVRVELKTDALNQQSRTAILRIGAKEEGTLRQHNITWNGRTRDTVYFSILDKEWPEVKPELEAKLTRAR
jgi:RimJ/RimL family protein N-acetyltransferase